MSVIYCLHLLNLDISLRSLSNEATGQRGCGRGRMAPMGQGVIPKEPGASCQVAPGPLMSLWEAVKEKVKVNFS